MRDPEYAPPLSRALPHRDSRPTPPSASLSKEASAAAAIGIGPRAPSTHSHGGSGGSGSKPGQMRLSGSTLQSHRTSGGSAHSRSGPVRAGSGGGGGGYYAPQFPMGNQAGWVDDSGYNGRR